MVSSELARANGRASESVLLSSCFCTRAVRPQATLSGRRLSERVCSRKAEQGGAGPPGGVVPDLGAERKWWFRLVQQASRAAKEQHSAAWHGGRCRAQAYRLAGWLLLALRAGAAGLRLVQLASRAAREQHWAAWRAHACRCRRAQVLTASLAGWLLMLALRPGAAGLSLVHRASRGAALGQQH